MYTYIYMCVQISLQRPSHANTPSVAQGAHLYVVLAAAAKLFL